MTIVRHGPKHGGPRKGAGRPKQYDAPRVNTSLERGIHSEFAGTCRAMGLEMTEVLDAVVARFLQQPNGEILFHESLRERVVLKKKTRKNM